MGMYFSEFQDGAVFETRRRTITEADVVAFAGISGDFNPLHTDEVFAASTPFGRRVAHGMLSVSVATGLANQLGIFEGTTIGLLNISTDFKAPVFFGDSILLRLTVAALQPSSKGGRGVVKFRAELVNQKGEAVTDGSWSVMLRDKPAA